MKIRRNAALLALVALTIGLSGCLNRTNDYAELIDSSNVLIHYDKQDRDRMDSFIERAKQKKYDYVLAVANTIEGGKLIYDLVSDQQDGRIHLRMDYSRDIYTGQDDAKQEYVCERIDWEKGFGERGVRLSSCEGLDADIQLFGFSE
ncbi:DUF4362 domain-containing protein [Cohnella fermenti]|uniref:DUF4362 domain-containing protein n=1 Tax=Cohnella fermenti TaxID=2565925 RepID=A0A4S4BUL8_9BACL|nr:DUF4362 domain-containing protein [Cohnella fermenti]THF78804.1 DUF4362 domain-containing protein [Cohnella fermenti]